MKWEGKCPVRGGRGAQVVAGAWDGDLQISGIFRSGGARFWRAGCPVCVGSGGFESPLQGLW